METKEIFFLELQDHGIPAQQVVNQELLRMHEETGIDLVATNDVHYTTADDADPHDILLCLQTNKKLADQDRMRYEGGQYYVKSPEEMAQLFPYALEALENTPIMSSWHRKPPRQQTVFIPFPSRLSLLLQNRLFTATRNG